MKLSFLLKKKIDSIDLMDFEGNLKDLPNSNNKDYAIQFISPSASYIVIKIEFDINTNEKKFTSLLNESKLNANMLSKKFINYYIQYAIIA